MRKIIPLLLLAVLLCQCNNNPQKPQNEPEKTPREQYPEKFAESYISERTLWLADELRGSDPEIDSSFMRVFTERYYLLLKEGFALPGEYVTELPAAWFWIELVEPLCGDLVVTKVEMLDDNHAEVLFDCNDDDCGFMLSFVGDDWLIDDIASFSRDYLANQIRDEREWLQSLDYQEMIEEYEADEELTEEEKEMFISCTNSLQEEAEEYFKKYPY